MIGHVNKLDAIESEAELSRTSVIIEISKQAVPKWKEKLKAAYGLPKTSKVNSVLFNVSLFTMAVASGGLQAQVFCRSVDPQSEERLCPPQYIGNVYRALWDVCRFSMLWGNPAIFIDCGEIL